VTSYYTSKKKFSRLFVGKKSNSGRNVYGKIVNLRCGSGLKKNSAVIDFTRRWSKRIALCLNLTKDKTRTCFIALLKYSNGTFSYVLASTKMRSGKYYYTTIIPPRFSMAYSSGCNTILRYLSYKSIFFNIEIEAPFGGKYARAGGTYCKMISLNFNKNTAKIILPTGTIKVISMFNLVTVGQASNCQNFHQFFTKAGYFRKLGFRPVVRGVAMNPVDNPHGGRTKTNSPEVTPWGKIAKHGK